MQQTEVAQIPLTAIEYSRNCNFNERGKLQWLHRVLFQSSISNFNVFPNNNKLIGQSQT